MYQTLNQALQQAAQTEHGIYFTNSLEDETFLSYAQLYLQARCYLSLLQQHGVKPGDEVVLQIDALPAFLQLYWACLLGAMVPVPLAFADVPDHAQKVSSVWPVLASPWLVTDSQDTFARLLKHAGQFDPTGAAAAHFSQLIFPRALVLTETELLSATPAAPAAVSGDDIAFIQFSSGSTGSPKGVVLTHHNLLVNIADMQQTFGLTATDVFLSWKPKSHDFGMIAFHLAPVVAALPQVHIPTKTYVWSPAIWFQAVDKHRASILGSPNFGYQHLLKLYNRRRKTPWQWDLSCVRTIINGAEPISPQLCQAFTDEMAQYGLPAGAMRCAYGLAEASLMVSLCQFDDGVRALYADRCQLNIGDRFTPVAPTDPAAVALVDCGLVFPSMQVRITDGQGQPLADGTIGCIEIKGGNVTAGYYRNQAATSRAVGADGWVNTEDLGFIWQGRLVFASRLKELIIIGGINYFPYDIERAILQVVGDEALNQYIACSLPDERSGSEQLAVFVYFKKDWAEFAPLLEQVKTVVEQQFGLTVSYVVPTDRIPKTTSGKVQRFRLRQQFFAGDFDDALQATGQRKAGAATAPAIAAVTAPAAPAGLPQQLSARAQQIRQRIRQLVQTQTGAPAFDDQQSFFQLGLNSARLLQLQEQLEQEFAVQLAGVDILEHASVDALCRHLLQAPPTKTMGSESIDPATPSCAPAPMDNQALCLPADTVAIVSMACRFPGDADTPAALWQLLQSGIDPVGPLPYSRWALDPQKDQPITAQAGAFLADVRRFDPHFFGITPKEARALDPQQRLLLEVCHEAFENAGWAVPDLRGSATGVFVGMSGAEYAQVCRDLGLQTGPYDSTGNMFNTAAGRLSYVFGLQGPSIALDSACASSLVGIHQAVQALQSGSCQQAVVAAVNLMLKPDGHLSYSQLNALSASGRCRSFDDAADGYIRSEGCGAVVLKPLRQALADGDPVLAVIRGCSINHNGHNGGLTVPSGAAQQKVIQQALQQAGLTIDDIDYLEAHGSGTRLGDPQEAQALATVFAKRQRPLLLGSVKSNLGHLEAAAGMAGLFKVLLSMQHNAIAANLHLQQPNTLINWRAAPLQLVDRLTAWPERPHGVKTAAITSLGINGSNAHLILQSYPATDDDQPKPGLARPQTMPLLLTWSAVSPAALQQSLLHLAQQLQTTEEQQLAAWCLASQLRRSRYPARFACLVRDKAQLQARLQRTLQTVPGDGAPLLPAVTPLQADAPVAFVYTGQGAVYPQIAASLYQHVVVFRQAVDRCAALFAAKSSQYDLTAVFANDPVVPQQTEHTFAQPAFAQALSFTIGYALTELWQALGVRPVAVLGHSIGEVAAAVCAGALSLPTAVSLVHQRGQLCASAWQTGASAIEGQAAAEPQAMASVLASAAQVTAWCAGIEGVWLAAVNSAANVTIAGRASAVQQVLAQAKAARVFSEVLPQTLAYHTPLLARAAATLQLPVEQACSGHCDDTSPVLFYSACRGDVLPLTAVSTSAYWQQQLQSPVLFAGAASALLKSGVQCVIEMGGNAVLTALLAELANEPADLLLLPSLRDGKDARQQLQESLAQLYLAGLTPHWPALWSDASEQMLATLKKWPLPNTAYARQDCWASAPAASSTLAAEPLQSFSVTGAAVPLATTAPVDAGVAGETQQQICRYICDLLADVAGYQEETISADSHFLALGLDSLMLVQLGRRLEREYAVEIGLNEFFKALYTPNRLAAFIAATRPAAAAQAAGLTTACAVRQESIGQPDVAAQPGCITQPALSATAAPVAIAAADFAADIKTAPQSARLSDASQTPLVQLMQQQLSLMQQQLALLQPDAPRSGAQAAIAQTVAAAPVAGGAPLARLGAQQWSPRVLTDTQQHFVQQLAARLASKHAGSKAYARQHNAQLADWLLRAHYLPETAEMAYLPVAQQARGCRFTDIDGNEFIDTCLGFTSNLFGHNPAFITEAIARQLEQGMILGPQAAQAGEVAALICELTGVERVAFTNSGTEAVMAALRVARAVTGRRKIVRFTTSYHGTFDAVLAQATLEGTAPLAIGVVPSLVDDTVVLKYGSAQSLAQIAALGDELAAVLVEPVQSRNPALQPVAYLQQLRALTAQHGIALIFDEMVFGFRCHPGGIQQRFNIRADIVTYGKVVGGGMPIGVLAGQAAYLDAIDGGDWLSATRQHERPAKQTTFFAGTFCKHPLAMAAAHAVLSHLKADGGRLQPQLDQLTADFANEVNAFFRQEQVPLKVSYFSSVYRYDLQPSTVPELLTLEADLFFKLLLEQGIYACYVWENRAGAFCTAHTPADVAAIVAAIRQATWQLRAGGFAFRTPTSTPTGAGPTPQQAGDAVTSAAANSASAGASTEASTGASTAGTLELSAEERRMYVLSHLPGGELAYRICGGLHWQGSLDVPRLRQALQQLVDRHQALRTGFVASQQQGQWQLQRCVANAVALPLQLVPGRPPAAVLPVNPAPLSLREAPLWRLTLWSAAADEAQPNQAGQNAEHWLLLEFSHLIADGISVSLFIDELCKAYQGQPLPVLSATPQDYVERQQALLASSRASEQLAYWQQQLARLPASIQWPSPQSRPAQQSFDGAVLAFSLDAAQFAAIRQQARQLHCTPFIWLFSCYLLLLQKISRADASTTLADLAVGVPVDQRPGAPFANTLGMFAQTLVIRPDWPGLAQSAETDFAALVAQLADCCQNAYAHSQLPLDLLIEQLNPPRDLSRNALFDTMFIYEQGDSRSQQLTADAVQFSTVPVQVQASAFDLTMELTAEQGQLTGRLIYATSVLDAATVARLASQYQQLVATLLRDPRQRLTQLVAVSDDEQDFLLSSQQQTARDFSDWLQPLPGKAGPAKKPKKTKQAVPAIATSAVDSTPFRTVPALLANAVACVPDAIALRCPDSQLFVLPPELSYQALWQAVCSMAQQLTAFGVGPGDFVGLLLPRGPELITSFFAIQALGAAYVPLDPDYPTQRLQQMLRQSQPKVLLSCAALSGAQLLASLDETANRCQLLDVSDSAWLNRPGSGINLSADAQLPAYCLFTSGSTGQPKGVLISQASLLNFICTMTEQLDWPARAVTLGLTSVSFDIFALEVFVTLCRAGLRLNSTDCAHAELQPAYGTLVLASERQQRDPALLRQLIAAERVNVVQLTGSRLILLLSGQQSTEVLAGVSHLLVGGEAFPASLLPALTRVPGLRTFNMYGPTETTVWSALKMLTGDLSADDQRAASTVPELVSVGRPVANTSFYVLGHNGQLLSPGMTGELWIGGAGVALGYLADDARTALAFRPDPFSQHADARMYQTGDRARWLENGELQILGRLDQQVKLRGYRIELAEIEQQLQGCQLTLQQFEPLLWQVQSCAVVLQQDSQGQQALVAFCTLVAADMPAAEAAGTAHTPVKQRSAQQLISETALATQRASVNAQLRAELSRRLPDYMVPAAVVWLAALPLTPNGKIDRKALPALDQQPLLLAALQAGPASDATAQRSAAMAQDDLQQQVYQAWQHVLGARPLADELSFFAQGGNSMSLVLLAQALDQQFPALLDVADLFAHPSIQAMTALIRQRQRSAATPSQAMLADMCLLPADYALPPRHAGGGGHVAGRVSHACQALREMQQRCVVLLAATALLAHKISQQSQIAVFYQTDASEAQRLQLDFSQLTQSSSLLAAVCQQLSTASAGPLALPTAVGHSPARATVQLLSRVNAKGWPLTPNSLCFSVSPDGSGLDLQYDAGSLDSRKMQVMVTALARIFTSLAAEPMPAADAAKCSEPSPHIESQTALAVQSI